MACYRKKGIVSVKTSSRTPIGPVAGIFECRRDGQLLRGPPRLNRVQPVISYTIAKKITSPARCPPPRGTARPKATNTIAHRQQQGHVQCEGPWICSASLWPTNQIAWVPRIGQPLLLGVRSFLQDNSRVGSVLLWSMYLLPLGISQTGPQMDRQTVGTSPRKMVAVRNGQSPQATIRGELAFNRLRSWAAEAQKIEKGFRPAEVSLGTTIK